MTEKQGLKLDNTFIELLRHNTALYGEDASRYNKKIRSDVLQNCYDIISS